MHALSPLHGLQNVQRYVDRNPIIASITSILSYRARLGLMFFLLNSHMSYAR